MASLKRQTTLSFYQYLREYFVSRCSCSKLGWSWLISSLTTKWMLSLGWYWKGHLFWLSQLIRVLHLQIIQTLKRCIILWFMRTWIRSGLLKRMMSSEVLRISGKRPIRCPLFFLTVHKTLCQLQMQPKCWRILIAPKHKGASTPFSECQSFSYCFSWQPIFLALFTCTMERGSPLSVNFSF